MSTPPLSVTASSAADTSPSVMNRIRAPASRISFTASAWRDRSSMMIVTSPGSVRLRSATRRITSDSGSSRLRQSAIAGPPAIFSMYTHGPGSNIVPRSASAITDSAAGWPCAVSRVPSSGSTAMSTSGGLPSPIRSPL